MLPHSVLLPHDIIAHPGFICLVDGNTGRTITSDAGEIILFLLTIGYDSLALR